MTNMEKKELREMMLGKILMVNLTSTLILMISSVVEEVPLEGLVVEDVVEEVVVVANSNSTLILEDLEVALEVSNNNKSHQ